MYLSQYFTCLLFQPPPKRPLAYANQNETDEERQFRRVFQQLAGDVSTPAMAADLLSVLPNVVFNFHFIAVSECHCDKLSVFSQEPNSLLGSFYVHHSLFWGV